MARLIHPMELTADDAIARRLRLIGYSRTTLATMFDALTRGDVVQDATWPPLIAAELLRRQRVGALGR